MTDLKDLSLYLATREQAIESRKRSFKQWNNGLSLEQYLARDVALENQENAIDGKFLTWVLAPRDDPETLDFKCACETYGRSGRYYVDGELKTVTAYGVASVFTPAEKRKKGYANRMMRLLHWVLADEQFLKPFPAEWGAPPPRIPLAGCGYFSALWSDVGSDFYKASGDTPSTNGWVVTDPISTIWDVTAAQATQPESGWKWLDEKETKEVWREDVPLLERDMVDFARTRQGKPAVAFMPDAGVAEYQQNRGLLNPSLHPYLLKSWGIKATSGDLAYATWTIQIQSPTSKTLLMTRLRVQNVAQFQELMSAVTWYAKDNAYQMIEIWNLPAAFLGEAEKQGGTTSARPKHLPALKFYAGNEVDWVFNEK
ncbi:hypothetical protein HDZ31DRAFT_33402 [Schizophyllum fasciatum]